MNLIIYLIAGAIVGYVASRIMHTNGQQGVLLDIVVGVIGAFLKKKNPALTVELVDSSALAVLAARKYLRQHPSPAARTRAEIISISAISMWLLAACLVLLLILHL